MSSKEDEVVAEVRKKKPDLTKAEEERIRAGVRSIEADPHVCPKCWSGGAYLDGVRVCDCWSAEKLAALEAGLAAGTVMRREENDVTYFETKLT